MTLAGPAVVGRSHRADWLIWHPAPYVVRTSGAEQDDSVVKILPGVVIASQSGRFTPPDA